MQYSTLSAKSQFIIRSFSAVLPLSAKTVSFQSSRLVGQVQYIVCGNVIKFCEQLKLFAAYICFAGFDFAVLLLCGIGLAFIPAIYLRSDLMKNVIKPKQRIFAAGYHAPRRGDKQTVVLCEQFTGDS